MSLTPPQSVQKLQAALHAKAKGSPSYRFYALYDKVYRKDVLSFAYDCCKSNKGAAGVDGQTFEDIEAYGPERWLGELTQELKSRTYCPTAVRRVNIPKPDGRNRDEGRGTPQGSPISPLLSNLYMRRFVLGWKALGHERRSGACIVNYADDFVICCRGNADQGGGTTRLPEAASVAGPQAQGARRDEDPVHRPVPAPEAGAHLPRHA